MWPSRIRAQGTPEGVRAVSALATINMKLLRRCEPGIPNVQTTGNHGVVEARCVVHVKGTTNPYGLRGVPPLTYTKSSRRSCAHEGD